MTTIASLEERKAELQRQLDGVDSDITVVHRAPIERFVAKFPQWNIGKEIEFQMSVHAKRKMTTVIGKIWYIAQSTRDPNLFLLSVTYPQPSGRLRWKTVRKRIDE